MDTEGKNEKPTQKRGRKRKTEVVVTEKNNIVMIIEELEPTTDIANTSSTELSFSNEENTLIETDSPVKKRGRKPKGGKLITKKEENHESTKQIANVILHLKCSLQDLNDYNNKLSKIFTDPLSYNPEVPPSIMTFDLNNKTTFSIYENLKSGTEPENSVSQFTPISNDVLSSTLEANDNKVLAYEEYLPKTTLAENICQICNEKMQLPEQETDDVGVNIKEINHKLKNLKLQLYKNMNTNKKSACFWCTYEYDNQPCYIPKYELDGNLYGYGSFCRPECAVAFLMKENIDDSMKFERYHLLNQIYSKVYNFKKNIKPAPNPYFLLEKFYGNLSIQEYRKLLKTEHMLLVVEKPMTLILPELHDDNDDFIMNIYGGKSQKTDNTNQNGTYKVKKQSEKSKGPTKNAIMKENFGF
jgi:hypothetical protein